ncbi:alanine--glyoxylate aminotransferase family protein [Dehalococcoidia bacterium]|nr:alanine--glyoxylate aminotransferase family protein [Dehalococcoidia bacterium]
MLRIPGPTPCPEEVLQAMTRQMINHRGVEFEALLRSATARLKEFFQTKGDVLILTASGTGGMEAAIVNTLSPGDKVLAVINGVFGERFADIAEAYGAEVERLAFPWGQPGDPDAVRRALDSDRSIKAVLVTHNETSTGVTSDLAAISAVVKQYDKLLLVDAISSLGCIDLQTDAWQCDVVVTGSQKGWMIPPGLAFISVSPKAWEAHARAMMPRFYWDFAQAKKFLERGQTPWTPAVSILYALAVALELMAGEGLANIFARHARIGQRTRDEIKALGLPLFAAEKCASNTVTAVKAPDGLDAKRLLTILREEHDVVLAGGQRGLAGKIFRIGHLGWVTESDIDAVIERLRTALPKAGFATA